MVVDASSSASAEGDVVTTTTTAGLQVTSFNVLAPCYRRIKQPDGETVMEATFPDVAMERQTRVLDMLSDLSSSVVCLQVT